MKCPNCKADLPDCESKYRFNVIRSDMNWHKKMTYALADRLAKITGSTPENVIRGVAHEDHITTEEI